MVKYTCSTVVKFVGKLPLGLFGKEEKDQKSAPGYKEREDVLGWELNGVGA